ALVVLLIGAGLLIWDATRGPSGPPKAAGKPCRVQNYGLDIAQARNATTIAAVGKRLGMPDHAVSIALATAYLESGLHNLAHGVGLQEAMATELGLSSLSAPLAPARGWTVGSWLVGHASDFKLAAVSFGGQHWTASTGQWTPDPTAGDQVQIAVSAPGSNNS